LIISRLIGINWQVQAEYETILASGDEIDPALLKRAYP
jgi:hypothetical protein